VRRGARRGVRLALLAGLAALAYGAWALGGRRAFRRVVGQAERRLERRESPPALPATGRGAPLDRDEVTGRLARGDLVESSGAAASLAHPGVLFTINDSGHDATLYAIDLTGDDRGTWRLRGATNVDWEAVSVGPCRAPGGAPGGASCVYVGDVGDNEGRHPSRAIYRVPEPDAAAAAGAPPDGTLDAERLIYAYPDGGQDVEAMWVAADGAVRLVTKREHRRPDGTLRPALVYRLAPELWARPTSHRSPALAELVDSIPAIVPGSAPFRVVTDAAPSPDGRSLAVRTYWQLWVLATDPRTGQLLADPAPRLCDLSPLAEEQGEGIAWLPPGAGRGVDALVLTSEGKGAPLHVVACGGAPNRPPAGRGR
jgi:hypothetical protein